MPLHFLSVELTRSWYRSSVGRVRQSDSTCRSRIRALLSCAYVLCSLASSDSSRTARKQRTKSSPWRPSARALKWLLSTFGRGLKWAFCLLFSTHRQLTREDNEHSSVPVLLRADKLQHFGVLEIVQHLECCGGEHSERDKEHRDDYVHVVPVTIVTLPATVIEPLDESSEFDHVTCVWRWKWFRLSISFIQSV